MFWVSRNDLQFLLGFRFSSCFVTRKKKGSDLSLIYGPRDYWPMGLMLMHPLEMVDQLVCGLFSLVK